MRLLRQHIQIRQEPRQGDMDLPQALAHGGFCLPFPPDTGKYPVQENTGCIGHGWPEPGNPGGKNWQNPCAGTPPPGFPAKGAPDTETRWKYPSRRDAWTKEKRQLAREQAYERLRERKEKK